MNLNISSAMQFILPVKPRRNLLSQKCNLHGVPRLEGLSSNFGITLEIEKTLRHDLPQSSSSEAVPVLVLATIPAVVGCSGFYSAAGSLVWSWVGIGSRIICSWQFWRPERSDVGAFVAVSILRRVFVMIEVMWEVGRHFVGSQWLFNLIKIRWLLDVNLQSWKLSLAPNCFFLTFDDLEQRACAWWSQVQPFISRKSLLMLTRKRQESVWTCPIYCATLYTQLLSAVSMKSIAITDQFLPEENNLTNTLTLSCIHEDKIVALFIAF